MSMKYTSIDMATVNTEVICEHSENTLGGVCFQRADHCVFK